MFWSKGSRSFSFEGLVYFHGTSGCLVSPGSIIPPHHTPSSGPGDAWGSAGGCGWTHLAAREGEGGARRLPGAWQEEASGGRCRLSTGADASLAAAPRGSSPATAQLRRGGGQQPPVMKQSCGALTSPHILLPCPPHVLAPCSRRHPIAATLMSIIPSCIEGRMRGEKGWEPNSDKFLQGPNKASLHGRGSSFLGSWVAREVWH